MRFDVSSLLGTRPGPAAEWAPWVRLAAAIVFIIFGTGKFSAHASEVGSFRGYGIRQQLLVELEDRPPASFEELGPVFQVWVEQVYHRRVHTETGQAPLERFLAAGAPSVPTELVLREAFRWSERRTVSKTGTVGMHGNTYEVDPELAGPQVDLIFDPLELAAVEVRLDDRRRGMAVPLQIKRHVHPRVQPPVTPAEPTGIDYLALIEKRHDQVQQKRIDYCNLPASHDDYDDHDDDRGDDGMSIDRLRAHWGAVAQPVHQGVGGLDAVRVRRSPGGGRPGRLDRFGASVGRGLRRGRRRQNGRRPGSDRGTGLEPLLDHLPPEPGDRGARALYPDRHRVRRDPAVLSGDADPASDRSGRAGRLPPPRCLASGARGGRA